MKDLTNLQTFSDQELFQILDEMKGASIAEDALLRQVYQSQCNVLKTTFVAFMLNFGVQIAYELAERMKGYDLIMKQLHK